MSALLEGRIAPEVGAWVQRVDDGRIGQVALVARAGEPNRTGNPFLMVGDIEVAMSPGSSIVTRIKSFWAKWRPVDLQDLARRAMAEAGVSL